MTKSSWFLVVSSLVLVSGCGSSNGCPNGYEPMMGMCVEVGSPPDSSRPDAAVEASDAWSAGDAGVGDVGPMVAMDDAGMAGDDAGMVAGDAGMVAMPDAFVVPDAGCPFATLFADADGDGFGDASRPLAGCVESRAGYTRDATDCSDACATCHPGGTESCNGADDDCDAAIDDGVLLSFYVDADGDGFGVGTAVSACTAPAGHSATAGDCNDACSSCRPGGTETCNALDDDCDGAVDDGVTTTFYVDADGDTYGRADMTRQACTQPAGHASRSGDCDDASGSTSPGASETCNDIDDDCDGSRDEGLSRITYRVDCDGDGYTPTVGESIDACRMPLTAPTSCPSGRWMVPTPASDCHDGLTTVFPGQTMVFSTRMTTPPTTGLFFDYDCNGSETLRDPYLVNCDAHVYGWRTSVPGCGVGATYDACGFGTVLRTQSCR